MKVIRSLAVATGGVLALALAPVAAAHVTVDPAEAAANSFARFDIRVPTEGGAPTTKVTLRLPKELTFVGFQPKPGWKRTVVMAKLAKPITADGETVTERVAQVTWSGGSIAPGEFDEFGISARMPDTPGKALVFPTLQTYQGGEVVRWIGPPDAEEPAPRILLTAAASEGDRPTETTAAPTGANDESDSSSTVAIVLSIIGIVAGLIALGVALYRKPRAA
jgi:periplasmic copper chaperone A